MSLLSTPLVLTIFALAGACGVALLIRKVVGNIDYRYRPRHRRRRQLVSWRREE
jgi:hypothetical protein